MRNIQMSVKKTIVGKSIRTTNQEAMNTIPAHWQEFYSTGVAAKIPNKVSETVYAVYTDFENEGENNEGVYTFLIGVEVDNAEDLEMSEFSEVSIPTGSYVEFEVEKGKPEKVFEKWMEIWQMSELPKSFVCDYEQYSSDGAIGICIGVN